MKNKLIPLILFITCLLLSTTSTALATYLPSSVANNKMGVHILDPAELDQAAQLVNSSGGDWGYVTVPIQPTDRNQDKWRQFMQKAAELHLIPIIRITTIPKGGTWATGADTDLVDFANFLTELPWPTQNRYIVLFNEVNRASEWGGEVNPVKYANILKNARTIFKERSAEFFLLGPALDTALPESDSSMSASNYLKAMEASDPTIWSYLDGWASHSYPNPGFTASPTKVGWQSIVNYKTETGALNLAPKPVFITETGWDQTALSPNLIDSYWKQAWTIWNNDSSVIAVTPFVLQGGNQFGAFSLLSSSGNYTPSGSAIFALKKVAGQPKLSNPNQTAQAQESANTSHTTDSTTSVRSSSNLLLKIENFFRQLFGLPKKNLVKINSTSINVELADNAKLWEKGLSDRDSLADNSGMLFIFPSVHTPVFWMKNMHFPIDIIWIRDGVITAINHSVPVQDNNLTNLPTYSPPEPVDMVLEVLAGYAKTHSIEVGDSLTILQ